MDKVFAPFRSFFQMIREINEKYKTPELQMTPMVRISLLFLRIYLLTMVAIIFLKFITTVIHP